MEYAVAGIMDQTIGYVTTDDVDTADMTIQHPKAHLFDSIEEASVM